MKFVRYVTQQNDRWDLISQRFYGTAYEWPRIVQANPTAPIRALLDEGIVLAIPLLERAELATQALLPPWKRVA